MENTPSPYVNSSTKRILDLLCAVPGILPVLPVLAVASMWCFVFSRENPIFLQQRVGHNRQLFTIYKLKTMRSAQGHALGNTTIKSDPRLIFGGEFIRNAKLDELPQILNVIDGSMSLVGPRPTTADDYDRMTPAQAERTACRPGMTGLAQLSGNTSLKWTQRIEHDLDYLRTATLMLDIKLIAKTATKAVFSKLSSDPKTNSEW